MFAFEFTSGVSSAVLPCWSAGVLFLFLQLLVFLLMFFYIVLCLLFVW